MCMIKDREQDLVGHHICPVAEPWIKEKKPRYTLKETHIEFTKKLLSNLGNNNTVAQACSSVPLPLNWLNHQN